MKANHQAAIDRATVEGLAAEMGATVGRLEVRLGGLEERTLAAVDAAVELLLQLEQRIAEIERRMPQPRPRLVDVDAA